MSSVTLNVEISFPDIKTTDLFYMFLSGYDADENNDFVKEKTLLTTLDLDADTLLSSQGAQSSIYNVTLVDDVLRFELEGGVHAGYDFWEKLRTLFLEKKPAYLYATIFNDQVGEYEIQVFNGKQLAAYGTGNGEEIDELLFQRFDEEDSIAVVKQLLKEKKIPLQEFSDEKISLKEVAAGLQALQDEDVMSTVLAVSIIKGFILFLLVFLIGWLALDYFWTALACGLIMGLAYIIKQHMILSEVSDEYGEMKDDMVEELKEMGMSDDEARQASDKLEAGFTKVVKRLAENENND
jgi:hypothetical protein